MLSGEIHTFSAFLTQSRAASLRNKVVSLERTSIVLFHLLVPMMVNSDDLFALMMSPEVFSNSFRYLLLTGRSVESRGSP